MICTNQIQNGNREQTENEKLGSNIFENEEIANRVFLRPRCARPDKYHMTN